MPLRLKFSFRPPGVVLLSRMPCMQPGRAEVERLVRQVKGEGKQRQYSNHQPHTFGSESTEIVCTLRHWISPCACFILVEVFISTY